ncbi:uncharacterized protein LOC129916380 [Episyrphus balteatus]|uniref:uncharacterized protein LOC129916380 n=1 Tax=Episyrphus balteatus TaxID=286459 RepID=UPI00248660F5|nr:uncharacterized protein LOC129916380 [Episyrphus balteatus]
MTTDTCGIADVTMAAAATMDNVPSYSPPSFGQFVALSVNIVVQIFISFVAVYMSYMCFKLKLKKTAFHAWFCSIGYCCLMAEGMMTFYEGNALMHPFDNYTKTTIHLVLSAAGGLMGMIGSLQKFLEVKKHFYTFHGKIGLFATCLCIFSFTSGIASLYIEDKKKVVHTIISLIVFSAGMCAQYTGYETSFFKRKVDPEMKLLFKYLVIVIVVLSCISPVKGMLIFFAGKIFS